MDSRVRDGLRWFQGQRLAATARSRKTIAAAWAVSRQAVDAHVRGEVDSISYERLAELARRPECNPYAVLSGAAVAIEQARASSDAIDLATRLSTHLSKEQEADGAEDQHQQRVTAVLGALAYMHDMPTLAFKRKAAADLDAWIDAKLADVDAALAAIGTARALRTTLGPVSAH